MCGCSDKPFHRHSFHLHSVLSCAADQKKAGRAALELELSGDNERCVNKGFGATLLH